jgi:hypothetical protein
MNNMLLAPINTPASETLGDHRLMMRWVIEAQWDFSGIDLQRFTESLAEPKIAINLETTGDRSALLSVIYDEDVLHSDAMAASSRAILLIEELGPRISLIQRTRRYLWKTFLAIQEHEHDFDSYLSPLMITSREGDLEEVHRLISEDATIPLDARGPTGRTALMYAASTGRIEIMQLLLSKGAMLSVSPPLECSTVQSALGGGIEAMKFLLDSGADVDERNRYGETALMYAAVWGDKAMVELLLERGASARARDQEGVTAGDRAARYGKNDVVTLLQAAEEREN